MSMRYAEDFPEGSQIRAVLEAGHSGQVFPLRGRQYYSMGRWDDVLEKVIWPEAGEPLQLVREPDNRVHGNAVAIYCNNGRDKIGHLPWDDADELAPLLDRGVLALCFMMNPGYREDPHSSHIAVFGPVIAERDAERDAEHQQRLAADEEEYQRRVEAGDPGAEIPF